MYDRLFANIIGSGLMLIKEIAEAYAKVSLKLLFSILISPILPILFKRLGMPAFICPWHRN